MVSSPTGGASCATPSGAWAAPARPPQAGRGSIARPGQPMHCVSPARAQAAVASGSAFPSGSASAFPPATSSWASLSLSHSDGRPALNVMYS